MSAWEQKFSFEDGYDDYQDYCEECRIDELEYWEEEDEDN